MKNSKYHIFCSWILLFCFAAGQYMIYAHQHNLVKGAGKTHAIVKNTSKQAITDKCQLCDAMHHAAMDTHCNTYAVTPLATTYIYRVLGYDFKSIQLILSGGRAPPAGNFIA